MAELKPSQEEDPSNWYEKPVGFPNGKAAGMVAESNYSWKNLKKIEFKENKREGTSKYDLLSACTVFNRLVSLPQGI